MSLEFREEVQGGEINLGVVSVEMVFKALILCEVTKEEETDRGGGKTPGLSLQPPTSGEICTLQLGFGTLRVSRLSVGRGGGGDVIGSVSDQWLCRVTRGFSHLS